MDTLQTLIATTIASLVSSVLVALWTKSIETRHTKDLEHYKSQLQSQYEHARLQIENDWQKKFFDYQTRFSSYYQHQSEVIKEIYSLLSQTHRAIAYLVGPFQPAAGSDSQKEVYEKARTKYRALSDAFFQNRIYLEEDMCIKIESVLHEIHGALMNWGFSQNPMMAKNAPNSALEAWQAVDRDIPPLLSTLEHQFRQSLTPQSLSKEKEI